LPWRPDAEQRLPPIYRLFILTPLGFAALSAYFLEEIVNSSLMGPDGWRAEGYHLRVGTRDMYVISSERIRCKFGRCGLRLRSAVEYRDHSRFCFRRHR